ncbi:hypothetical protein DFH28DRAFT_888429 [Melampsora americana]|nr:hypothetical protein DFH28DRAFT_888429 [Melampsora americana]
MYNPRLNVGWGLSDGEGLERNWSDLSPLVSPNRYVTKQHRLDGIHLKTTHQNEILAINAARSASSKLRMAETTLDEASKVLQRLQAENPEYTIDYFAKQWERQKECQLAAMADGAAKKLEEHLVDLLDLEEKLRDALSQLSHLRRKRRHNQTDAEREAAMTLPTSIVAFETEIGKVVEQLGSEDSNIIIAGPKAQALIRVRLAKMKLYEAKVGIVVAQKRWDKSGQGTKVQQNLKDFMKKKQLSFKRKWDSYRSQVTCYNAITPLSDLQFPTLDVAKGLPFEDIFWNVGPLSHPLERWAVDKGTIEGIQSYLKHRSSCQELRRIGREIRQMVSAAIKTQQKLDDMSVKCSSDWDFGNEGKALIEMVQSGQRISKDVWEVSVEVLKTVHDNQWQSYSRKWMAWNSDMGWLLCTTLRYTKSSVDQNEVLIRCWNGLVSRAKVMWEGIVNAESIEASGLDVLEIVEQNLTFGEDDEDDVDQLLVLEEIHLIDDSEDEESDNFVMSL